MTIEILDLKKRYQEEKYEILKCIKRVLKKDGIFLIIEHVKAPDAKVIKFQNKLEPFWKIIAGGCHLTRDTNRILEETGFNISSIEEMYLPGTPKFIGYNIWASLRKIK